MILAWDDTNREHLAKHDVTPGEAEEVVRGASPPFPRSAGDGKYMVWGSTSNGRLLQVLFAYKRPEDVPFESLSSEDWAVIGAGSVARVIRVIHAMDLTPKMKRQYRRRRS